MAIGEKIKKRMEELGLNTPALAKKSGVPAQTIYNYTYGRAEPTCTTMKKIAVALDKTVDWFLEPDLTDPKLVAMFEKAGKLSPEENQSVMDFMTMVEKNRREKRKVRGKQNASADKKP